jgi:hypothetical protein
MTSLIRAASAAALSLGLAAGQAQAKGLCKLTGSYSDDYGSTTSIKGKSGTIKNSLVCATAYTFKVSDETATGFTVTGKNKTKSCGTFSANLTFGADTCTTFSGTVTIDGGQLSDTFTKIEGPMTAHRAPPAQSDMLTGLHQ